MSERQREKLAELRARTERELARYGRRTGVKLWHSLALIGSVGWPIVLLALSGAWFGRYCDAQLSSGIRCSVLFLVIGAGFGTYLGFRALRKEQP